MSKLTLVLLLTAMLGISSSFCGTRPYRPPQAGHQQLHEVRILELQSQAAQQRRADWLRHSETNPANLSQRGQAHLAARRRSEAVR